MSSKSLDNKRQKPTVNTQLKSGIVHKPFATGTINIFNPYRSKKRGEINKPKLSLNAELEKKTEKTEINSIFEPSALELPEREYQDRNWLDSLLSPWGISAIAILFFANLISAAVIWRNTSVAINPQQTNLANSRVPLRQALEGFDVPKERRRTPVRATRGRSSVSTVGNADLSAQEFMPLNLSTLSKMKPIEDTSTEVSKVNITPISPALAPLNNVTNLSAINTQYYYILAEYTGDKSLSKARQKAKQISLVNLPQGVFIYLGAFTDREQAGKFVAQLQKENFAAYIYPFN